MRDEKAFIFNHQNKFVPNDFDKAICMRKGGFCFGNLALFLDGDYLNNKNEGRCLVGKDKFYDIEENERGESPLTGLKDQFTCSFLEVYKILFD